MNKEVCGVCNNPVWLCHSTHPDIDFEVSVKTCYAKAEIEDYEKTNKNKQLGSGEYLIATPVEIEYTDGTESALPSRVEAYNALQ